ncbi:hypothetical protein FSP39_010330 [Pinctada imbricata]|uniref:Uncharacterized protein n=1 Tax=Pinctada imbricata TaxID=66713 RepID=A0AA89C5Y3_PINIB|nr:hypothetical protein FSP39_010330 [Pinctada imbricata]
MAGIEKKSLKESALFSDNKSDEPRVKKPRTSDSSDTESLSSSEKSSENDSDRPYVLDRSDSPQIPCVLSKWNRRSLELLNINATFDYDASPLQIFDLIETRKSFLETVQRIRVLMARSSFTQWMKILEMQTSNFTEPNLSSLDQIWPLFRDDLSNSFIPRPDPADIDIPEHLMLWFTR